MKARIFRTLLSLVLLAAIAVITSWLSYASASDECSKNSSAAIREARKALGANDPAKDRAALTCLVDAFAALDAKLQGLSDGSVPFDGQIYIPKGFVIVKPPAKEGN